MFITSMTQTDRKADSYQSLEFTASEYPGVSTTVSRSFTPRSSISTVDDSIFTVRSTRSVIPFIYLLHYKCHSTATTTTTTTTTRTTTTSISRSPLFPVMTALAYCQTTLACV